MSYVEVRQLEASDWALYKEIRLRALQDSPDSFCASFDNEAAFTDEHWQERLGTDGSAYLIAELDGNVIGLVCGVLPSTNDAYGNIYQMWVDPEFRGNGVGKVLLARIIHWAMNGKAPGLELGVTTINEEAVSLYELAGFTTVGELVPLRDGSELNVATMHLEFGKNDE